MKKLNIIKALLIAAGIFISVAFYFLSGTGDEILKRQPEQSAEETQEAAVPEGEAQAGEDENTGFHADDAGEASAAGQEVQARLSDEQMELLAESIRRAVREELYSICEEGYLESALANEIAAVQKEEAEHIGMVNLNTADKTELMQLEGIGEKRAEDILAYREERGGFKSIEEIRQVKGIKDSIFEKLREKIYV